MHWYNALVVPKLIDQIFLTLEKYTEVWLILRNHFFQLPCNSLRKLTIFKSKYRASDRQEFILKVDLLHNKKKGYLF